MSAFEKEKERNHPKRVDLSSRDAGSSQEQTQPGAASKSADCDTDRKKFFQSLLQGKNGQKVEATVPNTIPEESESEPDSPSRGETLASGDDSTDIIHSECNGNRDETLEHVEEKSSTVEDSLSATGVSSDVRGAEIAVQSMDQGTDSPDKGLNSNSNEIGESQAETSNVSESSAKDETETDEKENLTTSSENTLTEIDLSGKSDELVDEKPTEPSLENANKGNAEELSSSENSNGENLEDRTTNVSTPPEQATENHTDLLDEKDKPKDIDSSLTIAVKSSYIGAPCEANEDVQSSGESTGVSGREESVDPSESVTKNEDKSAAQSEETSLETHPSVESSPASTGSKPSQPGSPNSAPQTGAESSRIPTASSVAAGSSNGGSPDQKSTYKAYVNIPEYLWSPIHQRLLGDLLFAIESDVQVWRR